MDVQDLTHASLNARAPNIPDSTLVLSYHSQRGLKKRLDHRAGDFRRQDAEMVGMGRSMKSENVRNVERVLGASFSLIIVVCAVDTSSQVIPPQRSQISDMHD